MPTVQLNELPSTASLYAAAALKRNRQQLTNLPSCFVRIEDFSLNSEQIRRYVNQFSFNMQHGVPAPFMYLATQSTQLYMLTRHRFPLSPAGLVHLGITFNQNSTLSHDWKGTVEMSITNQQASRKGLLFDIETKFWEAKGSVTLTITSKYLAKAIKCKSHAEIPNMVSISEQTPSSRLVQHPISLDKSSGRRYAKLSGDYNPIHLYRWSSKLFGFKKPIIHGLHMVSEAYSALEKTNNGFATESAFQFKSPLYLPGSALLEIHKEDEGPYNIVIAAPNKLHLLGRAI